MKSRFFSPLLALIGLGLVFSPSAFAEDGQRKKREERRALKMSQMDNVQSQSAAYRKAAHLKRLESIKKAKSMLAGGTLTGEQKAMMKFRLAELYFEEGRYIYLNEMAAFEKEYDACFNAPNCNSDKMEPDNKKSQKKQKSAIRLYKDILANNPQYQRADQVLFFLGSALQEIKKPDEAVKHFTRLTRTYGSSNYLPDAYVQIGEYYFDKNNAFKALSNYKNATKYKNSPKYGFAKYKLAWCYYNVGDYGLVIEHMKFVVSYSQSSEGSDKKRMTLQEEALKDLVRFFADAGEMEEAYNYFSRLGKKNLISSMLKRLAGMYFEQGKFEQCINTYRRLIAENPQSTKAPDYQNEIILAKQKMNRKEETIAEINRLLRDYGKDSAWARANSANPDAIKKASSHVERSLRVVAINYHNEAKKLGQGRAAKKTFALAETAYRTYLKEFPSGKQTYSIRYAFSELLYKLKKFDEAYVQYLEVVKIDPKGKHSQFCAEAAYFAALEMVKRETREGKIQKRIFKTDIEPKELSEWEKNLLFTMDNYSSVYPDSKDTIKYLYESGELLFSKNRLDEASERYKKVISMNPKSKQATNAAKGIVDALAF
jgi:tetratricopeptide (TPR) repeat protein